MQTQKQLTRMKSLAAIALEKPHNGGVYYGRIIDLASLSKTPKLSRNRLISQIATQWLRDEFGEAVEIKSLGNFETSSGVRSRW